MTCFSYRSACVVTLLFASTCILLPCGEAAWGQTSSSSSSSSDASKSSSSSSSSSSSTRRSTPAHVALLKDAEAHTGLFRMWEKGNKLYAELNSSNYNREYIVLISIARGIGYEPLVAGYSWQPNEDTWIWKFRKVDDRIHVIRSNVRFRAKAGMPEQSAVKVAFTDSVLFSLRIVGKGPRGGDLVDFSNIFMSDLPQISQVLPGFGFSSTKSSWAKVKAFDRNVELEVAATYASSGRLSFDNVPDSRGVTVNVHYSISAVPNTGYKPRPADDRIGYFLTVVKNFNKKSERDQFERYINRWHLQRPMGASKAPYTPRQSIVFWIEKTVPHEYRQTVREGFLEWNKAFEKAGWLNAIEVRQQPDDADWDPEDINYNTFRWITSDVNFVAMGPFRSNPRTGQILDADIIFNAGFLQYWKEEFETLTAESVAKMTGGPAEPEVIDASPEKLLIGQSRPTRFGHEDGCRRHLGLARELAFGSAAIGFYKDAKVLAEEKEKLIHQAIKETVMHEVGHTLGLRHNFKGSKMLDLKKINSEDYEEDAPTVASVMDYNATNIVPDEWHQGNYYTPTIGPYDYWAIEYGYKPISGSVEKELKKIASRSGESNLSFATDEEASSVDPDPDSTYWDLGSDPLDYAKVRAQVVKEVIPNLVERTTDEGDDYTQPRRAFNILLSEHGQAMYFASRLIGGLYTSRSHKGDKDAKPPIQPVETEKQREALKLLEEQVLSDQAFQFPAEMFNYLSMSYWNHWGQTPFATRKDYPLHAMVSMWQTRILDQLLSSITLNRMHDTELKTPPSEDVLTTAELIERLTDSIFSELDSLDDDKDYTNRQPAISSLRRNLQREYLRSLARLAMGNTLAPDDCQTVAYAQLSSLEARISHLLKSNLKLDSYSRAHLQETASRISKVLNAELSLFRP